MTPRDDFLGRARRAMIGMEPALRDDILRELGSHIAESTAANGGDVRASLARLGSPEHLGRHYRELYGYGRAYKALFAVVAFLLAFPSIPVLASNEQSAFPYAFSIAFLAAAAVWVLWVSVAAGSRAGLIAGFAGFGARVAAFAFAALTQTGAETTIGGLVVLVAVSVMLVLLGWVPGTAKKVWSGPHPDL
jgi:hypothetical protein